MIDDQNTDWSKYFRGRRLHGDYEIRVEQAEFRELSLTASEVGSTVSMAVYRNGTKVIRSFKPDFVLIRQNLRDAGEDNKNLLLGLMYGGIPSVNNLTAIYNFQVIVRIIISLQNFFNIDDILFDTFKHNLRIRQMFSSFTYQ